MWLWILSFFIIVLAWAGWWFFGIPVVPWWVPVAITAAVVLFVVGVIVFRRVRAARAARALEKAIAQQAQEQQLAAKPERVAEIQELHKQFQQGIAALKQSKLGGGQSGADALYVLPWYAIVGPPGAGKTTALRHSGLVFPYLDPSGGGVRGVGGTRNCDWWFTNEAILLDTAGRYTTEADDHDEWMAFLEQLLKYRVSKPLNGVVVAVSVSELLDATDDQIQQTGRKVRDRIDEMQEVLQQTLPVYVLFTKVDLVAGFTEMFGDLKKSERSQAWGSTVRLDDDKSSPGKLFDREFDLLVERLHNKAIKRITFERSREQKEKAYQFPLEFAAIKKNLSDFMAACFAPATPPTDKKKRATFVGTPLLRGFYFTSGVQEGKPLDRVVGAMGRAFGLRGGASEDAGEKVESKSFFLRDVFQSVIFPDKDIAARTEAEIRRQRNQKILVAAVAAFFTLLFLVPSIISFVNNRGLVGKTEKVSNQAKEVQWLGPGSPGEKVEKLDELRKHVEDLHKNVKDGAPMGYGFPMDMSPRLYKPASEHYIAILREGFALPVRDELEKKLKNSTRQNYLEDYNNLKAYLLMNDERKHLNDEGVEAWEVGKLSQVWAEILGKTSSDMSQADLKIKLRPHVETYIGLLKRGDIKDDKLEKLDPALIASTREWLVRQGPVQRLYAEYVDALNTQKFNENGPDSPENLVYPPITLRDIFVDRPEIIDRVISSYRKKTKNEWYAIPGAYTYKGHEKVLASLDEGAKLLEREQWVLPLSREETLQGDKIQQALMRVREDYDNRYIQEWINFFKDVDVAIPDTNKEAIVEFKVLSTPDWAYGRLLRKLWENTQFDEMAESNAASEEIFTDGGLIDQAKMKVTRRIEAKTRGVRVATMVGKDVAERVDPVPEKFRAMVRFGVAPPPAKPKGDSPPPPPAPVELGTYVGKLADLAGEMSTVEQGPPAADTKKATEKFEDAVKTTEGLLLKMDKTGQDLMSPLLLNPLRQAYKAVIRHAGGAASGLWEVVVWPVYRDKIKDRYPFNLAATRDASFEDAVAFFKPKDGVLWGFYEGFLKNFHSKVGHKYVPQSHLDVDSLGNKPAKPTTPFNGKLYPCLERADEITDALWPGFAGEKPKVEFTVNLKTVSPIVSEIILEIDGQKRLYRNEKEFWASFTWPGPKPTGAKMRVRGAGGLDEEIVREGPWGIFRLFEAGTTTAVKDKDDSFTVTWQMSAPPVTVTMEVKPVRGNHPFPSSFFRATNCPPSIGDSFGKGGGKKG